MNKITTDEIERLANHKGGGISIYIPTHRHSAPPNMSEDQIRFKNAISSAKEKWSEYGGEWRDVEGSITKLEYLIDDYNFWQNTIESLAVFISRDDIEIYHLPVECEEYVSAGDGFNVAPLLVIDSLNQPYHLLAIAMDSPKFFKGDMYGLTDMKLDLPENPIKALNIDELHANSGIVRSHQHRGATSPHGEGDSAEAGEDERMKYLRAVEGVITSSEDYDSSRPVLVAGVDSEAASFCELTSMQNVVQGEYIQGNHTETPASELHSLARPVLHSEFIEANWREFKDQLGNLTGTGKSSVELGEVAKAAKEGRVDTLAIGALDVTRDSVSEAVTKPTMILRMGDDETFHRALEVALDVASNGGKVYGIEKDNYLPEGSTVGAIYRY